ncbi:MAG: sigma-54-dependent transcriptional regulator [Helicobacteraceae bacterium]
MKIAIVEDDINMRKSLEIAFSSMPEYEVVSFKNARDALKKLDETFELVITDLTMPGINGIEFLRELGGKYEAIVITGDATLNKAIDAMRLGAKDFITKPFEMSTLIQAIQRSSKVNKILKNTPKQKEEAADNPFGVVSPALKKPLDIAFKASKTDASCLLLGESGVGKEVFANYIHKNSSRSSKPFVAINMAAIPETLIEAELFGYEKGAFTGADTAKPGKFEEASGGTLFLDEIGEMPYSLQAKLLRVLQEKEIIRLGTAKKTKVDVRIISATNIDIKTSIASGEFREDLYYRLNTIPIEIPPLRKRKEEILPLAVSVLQKAVRQYALSEKAFGQEAQDELLKYSWPGNVRELISVCERAAILSESDTISREDLFIDARETTKSIDVMEKDLLKELIKETGKDLSKMAEILSLSGADLERKLKKYNL